MQHLVASEREWQWSTRIFGGARGGLCFPAFACKQLRCVWPLGLVSSARTVLGDFRGFGHEEQSLASESDYWIQLVRYVHKLLKMSKVRVF